MNAAAIMILNKIYRSVAVRMNEWENHRTESEYMDNLLFKIFLFQFVNSYTSLYYIAFFKSHTNLWGNSHLADSCPTPSTDTSGGVVRWGCPYDLMIQLATILGTNIVVGQAQEVLIPYFTTKFKKMYADRVKKTNVDALPKYEKEYYLNAWDGTVDEYCEMVIQYGYITLFAAAFPLAPVAAFINNVVEMRTDAYKWLTVFNKPFYRGADDIGGWYNILNILSFIAVITNGLLIAFSFPTLYIVLNYDHYMVLWVAVILEHAIFVIKYLIASFVPDVPEKIRVVVAKQHYIKEQLVKKFERQALDNANKRTPKTPRK